MENKILRHNYSGKSLLELREEFGIEGGGFHDNDWWLKKDFAKENAPKGVYEIVASKELIDLKKVRNNLEEK